MNKTKILMGVVATLTLLAVTAPAPVAANPMPVPTCPVDEIDSFVLCMASSTVNEVHYICHDNLDRCPL